MSYEIFIARGIAGIKSRVDQCGHGLCYEQQPQAPHHHLRDNRTQAGYPSGDGYEVTMLEKPGEMVPSETHSATLGTNPKGHAQPTHHSYGAKSRAEICRPWADGQKSETRPPLAPRWEHGFKERSVPFQQRQNPHDDQSPQDVSGSWPSWPSTTFNVPSVQTLCQTIQAATGPAVLSSPPSPSDTSTKWTVDKLYRHATNFVVVFVDGNLDAPHMSGEYPSAPGRSSKENTLAVGGYLPPSNIQRTQSRSYNNMSSSGTRSESSFPMFLDPFQGLPLDLDRQASDISDISGYIRPEAFSKHRDTLSRVSWSRKDSEHDEDEGFHSDDDEDDDDCAISSLVDKSVAIRRRMSCSSIASCVPAEVLHHIFSFLQPCDFEAARHACRSWFIASLDQRLASLMMKRAGCYSAYLTDLSWSLATSQDTSSVHERIQQHWLASKRLATEGRLSAAWHGSSLRSNNGHSSSRLSIRQTVDFTHIMSKDALQRTSDSDTFTVSTCGKFVLLTSGCDIYVYSIDSQNSDFVPLVRLAAESSVIAVSMDTSAGRFAVAALLDGRMGACWEIDDVVFKGRVGSLYNSYVDERPNPEHLSAATSIPVQPTKRDEISIIAEGMDMDLPSSIQFQALDSPSGWTTASSEPSSSKDSSTLAPPNADHQSAVLPVRVEPNAVYRNLGTKNDAPRSVAICPQRKCAAFGCRSGIELHWVDALTGAELNRWFPLAAPSDHLYFLPQRAGIDSAKKLRLISSAKNPATPSKKHKQHSVADSTNDSTSSLRARARSMTKLFHGNRRPSLLRNSAMGSTADILTTRSSSRAMDCDHYRAIPLSDGQHMLFTDPVTGFLCLGSDAPLGGPTKLVRKACMVPPHTEGVNQFESPVYYSVASDLRWGLRIVATYEDGRIVLYNIPSDCFERLRHIRSSPEVWDEWNTSAGQSDLMTDAFMLNREAAMASAAGDSGAVFKSLQIDGALLGYIDTDVESIAIDSTGGGLAMWVFHASGQATQMDIYVPRDHQISSRVVEPNGLIHDKPITPLPRAILKGHDNTPYDADGHQNEDYFSSHVRFVGLDGCCDHRSGSMCGPMVHKNEIDYSHFPRDEGISMTPGASDDEDDERPLQVELLTDWRAESLLRPYIVNVTWIDAH